MWYINLVCFFTTKTMVLGILWEIRPWALVLNYPHILCAGIGPLQLGVVLVWFIFVLVLLHNVFMDIWMCATATAHNLDYFFNVYCCKNINLTWLVHTVLFICTVSGLYLRLCCSMFFIFFKTVTVDAATYYLIYMHNIWFIFVLLLLHNVVYEYLNVCYCTHFRLVFECLLLFI